MDFTYRDANDVFLAVSMECRKLGSLDRLKKQLKMLEDALQKAKPADLLQLVQCTRITPKGTWAKSQTFDFKRDWRKV
jgi:hypothetical protein